MPRLHTERGRRLALANEITDFVVHLLDACDDMGEPRRTMLYTDAADALLRLASLVGLQYDPEILDALAGRVADAERRHKVEEDLTASVALIRASRRRA